MPLRPPQSRSTIGVDICNTSRIARLLQKKPNHVDFAPYYAGLEAHHSLPILENSDSPERQGLRGAPDGEKITDSDKTRRHLDPDLKLLAPSLNVQFLHRILRKEEIRLVRRFKDRGRDFWLDKSYQFVAGRWAAKEAVIKALKCEQRPSLKDILIWNWSNGRPFAAILSPQSREGSKVDYGIDLDLRGDELTEAIVDKMDGEIMEISISHDGNYAIASAIHYEAGAKRSERRNNQKVQPGRIWKHVKLE